MSDNFLEVELPVEHIEALLQNFDVEVSSPDGWVQVTDYVHKGEWDEYVLETANHDKRIRVSGGHLFETDEGWKSASDLCDDVTFKPFKVLTDTGVRDAFVFSTGKKIPIVDITVNHPNHRYFTDGVSSHNTGGGKSVMMCHVAANALKLGKNVLYISMEMAEERVAERVDANLMSVRMGDLRNLERDAFGTKIDKIRNKTNGKLIIKEYPMGSAHAGHFRALIEELKVKRGFTADLIVVDYLGICASQRVKNATANSYTILGSVAEELRSLAQEYNVPVLTGVQINRGGIDSSDMDITDTSDSMKIVHSLDLYIGIVRTEELDELGQVMIKQLKNRYGDPGTYKRFVIGMDASRSLLYDVEQSAQQGIHDSGQPTNTPPAFDQTRTGKRLNTESFKF